MNDDVEQRKLVIEIISTLVHIKTTMVELVLKPAGVPLEIYKNIIYRKDDSTGKYLSKRQMAPLILEKIESSRNSKEIIRQIIEIAAKWSNFHLAYDEFQARATVQKARELRGVIKLMEDREEKHRELARKKEIAKIESERDENLRKQSDLLLMMFDELAKKEIDAHRRGYLLEDLLNRSFDLHGIPVFSSFCRNEGGEQIDGAFKLEGWHYIVECRWREKLSDIRELDGLSGQISRSGRQTMGVFLSINRWSSSVVPLLKQNQNKSIILVDGYDFRAVLAGYVGLQEILLAKVSRLNLHAEPFYSVSNYLEFLNNNVRKFRL